MRYPWSHDTLLERPVLKGRGRAPVKVVKRLNRVMRRVIDIFPSCKLTQYPSLITQSVTLVILVQPLAQGLGTKQT